MSVMLTFFMFAGNEYTSLMDTLLITPQKKIPQWRAEILELLAKGSNVLIVGDTETTGTHALGDKKNFGKKDRLLEIGFLFYVMNDNWVEPLLDADGEQIFFHEYTNPLIEPPYVLERHNSIDFIPDEVVYHIHGIDEQFLEGRGGMVLNPRGERGGFVLPSKARTFKDIKPLLEELLCVDQLMNVKGKVVFAAHNALFDVGFMNAEWKKVEVLEEHRECPSFFEGFVSTLDTMTLFKSMYTIAELADIALERDISGSVGYSLDFIQNFYSIDIQRDMHGALLDSKILAEVLKSIMKDAKYLSSPLVRSRLGDCLISPRKKRVIPDLGSFLIR